MYAFVSNFITLASQGLLKIISNFETQPKDLIKRRSERYFSCPFAHFVQENSLH
jgi:hypothetical protein